MPIAVVSSKGSPGASTAALAMALTWPRPVILAEVDPRGGDAVLGYGRGQNLGAGGVLRLQMSAARQQLHPGLVWSEVVELGDGQRWLLPGLGGVREAGSVSWALVARALQLVDDGLDVIADCGTALGDRDRAPWAVWAAADLVALAVRPTMQGVQVARGASSLLREDLIASGFGPDRLRGFVVSGRRGYPYRQVAAELGEHAPLVGPVLPYDPDTADVLAGLRDQPRRRFTGRALMRAAGELGEVLGGEAQQYTHTPGVGQKVVTVVDPLARTRPAPAPAPPVGAVGDRRASAPMHLTPSRSAATNPREGDRS